MAFSGDSTGGATSDRVFLTSGGSIQAAGDAGSPSFSIETAVETDLPGTAPHAIATGWKDPVYCATGRGRFFQKSPAGEGEPFFLLYNRADELIGLYLYSRSEMPPPWVRHDELLGGGGLKLIDFDHWSLLVYFQDSTLACGSGRLGGGTHD